MERKERQRERDTHTRTHTHPVKGVSALEVENNVLDKRVAGLSTFLLSLIFSLSVQFHIDSLCSDGTPANRHVPAHLCHGIDKHTVDGRLCTAFECKAEKQTNNHKSNKQKEKVETVTVERIAQKKSVRREKGSLLVTRTLVGGFFLGGGKPEVQEQAGQRVAENRPSLHCVSLVHTAFGWHSHSPDSASKMATSGQPAARHSRAEVSVEAAAA